MKFGDDTMIFEKSCGAVVFRDETMPDGRKQKYVLMIKQSPASNFSFPKGHVEPGESETETACREVYEETAVTINIVHDFRKPVYYSPRPGAKKEVVYFVAETKQLDIRPQSGEISEVEWVDIDKAPRLLAHSNDRRVLALAEEYIKKKKTV